MRTEHVYTELDEDQLPSKGVSLKEALSKPVAPPLIETDEGVVYTMKVEHSDEDASVELQGSDTGASEGAAAAALQLEGLDPDKFEVTGFRTSRWTMPNGEEGVSRRFTFKVARRTSSGERLDIDELIEDVRNAKPYPRVRGVAVSGTAIVALGDMQFGKDLDGAEHVAEHAYERCARLLATAMEEIASRPVTPECIVVAWLGDHIEGFTSQGGANVWRTRLTLSEQVRLTRRVMLKAVELFASVADRLIMLAVPGNHGEPQRFSGKGVTRYDDSHDTEALLAVADACALNPHAYGHVEFYVPDTDEMTVTLELPCGTKLGAVHGHQWRPGKHFEWWRGQSFHASPLSQADVLLAGHLHHMLIEQDGRRTFVQVPAIETESTWYRHATGTIGAPGLLLLTTREGRVNSIEVIE